jgi:hypothetical protein
MIKDVIATPRDHDFARPLAASHATEIPNRSLIHSLEVLVAAGVPFRRLYRGVGQAETGSIRVRLHIRGRGARFAVAGARLLPHGPLRVFATTRAVLLPKMTLATHSPHYLSSKG